MMSSLKTALETLHRDGAWWQKVLIGGAWWLSVVGYPIAEGYQIESIENTKNGFPTPLPLWHDLGGKAVQGLFALVIDFTYFVFPLLLGGVILVCSILALSLAGTGATMLRVIGSMVGVLVVVWLLVVWGLSISPLAKRLFVGEAQLNQALSSKVIRDALDPLARAIYVQTRLQSVPVYLVPLALFGAAWWALNISGWIALILLWLALAALFYARLIVVHLYDAAARQVQQRRFEAFRARAQ